MATESTEFTEKRKVVFVCRFCNCGVYYSNWPILKLGLFEEFRMVETDFVGQFEYLKKKGKVISK